MKRIKLADGDEQDVYTDWRHVMGYLHRPGAKKAIRKRYNKRFRKIAKRDTGDRLRSG